MAIVLGIENMSFLRRFVMDTKELTLVYDRIEQETELEDLLVELGIVPSEADVACEVRRAKMLSVKRWTVVPMLRILWFASAVGIYHSLAMDAAGLGMVLSIVAFIAFWTGTLKTSSCFSEKAKLLADSIPNMRGRRAMLSDGAWVRDQLVQYCRSLVQKYRDQLLGDSSEVTKTGNELTRQYEAARSFSDRYRVQLDSLRGSNPDGYASDPAYMEMHDESKEAHEMGEKLHGIIAAFDERKKKLLDDFRAVEARIDEIDIRLDRNVLSAQFAAFKGRAADAVKRADDAVIRLIVSFREEACRLSEVGERLTRLGKNSIIEGRAMLETERVVQRALPSPQTIREATEEVESLSGVPTLSAVPQQ